MVEIIFEQGFVLKWNTKNAPDGKNRKRENSGVKTSGAVARVQEQGVTRERGAPGLECGGP